MNESTRIRVLLADDEPLLRVGAALLLGQADDIEVVAEAADGAEAIEVVRRQPVDVALVDIRMPNMDGLAAAEEIGRIAPKVRVIMLTTFGDEANVARALRAGAAGFLLKDTEPARILHAVRAAKSGDAVLSNQVARQVINQYLAAGSAEADTGRVAQARRRLAVLTNRERDVLVTMGHGLANAEIGQHLGLASGTVKVHVSRILTKLGCANRVQAAILAHDAGLLRYESG
ncbi:DNA-binding NarL/FixJ family response regulator [Kibdelosporangium banguiense]|uniref:DNA-binding NarL/FixJ family response regulator n=1 Tax=Kibdelosporangium banguiense TaxID=1365924 RepID=A0ABS4TR71_9PSEU|nr:response regulator transcription factor [Kibdelosporangium banguiense]MBP2326905.1 DNA-binding NarL/FixJ family response regulator [Kibdelosporangium banguiense]